MKEPLSRRLPWRFAMLGCGFWSRYQLAAWQELAEVTCVALYNRTRAKAEELAQQFQIDAVYDDAEELLRHEKLDFVDIVTSSETHSHFVELAARYGLPVICQKPLAPSFHEAESLVTFCRQAGVPLWVHENWRWQEPIRQFQAILRGGEVGRSFRARIDMISGFPVFDNQPFLRELEQMILADIGPHLLDVSRFLFGEAQSVYCQAERIHPDIRGEDVATVVMSMGPGPCTVTCNMAYAGNFVERECFPQTLIFVEAEQGSLELLPDYWIHQTTAAGTTRRRYPPPSYRWADPAYEVVHSSIVACHRDLLRGLLQENGFPETTAEDNLESLRLVFDAYESARRNAVVPSVSWQAPDATGCS